MRSDLRKKYNTPQHDPKHYHSISCSTSHCISLDQSLVYIKEKDTNLANKIVNE